MKALLILAVFFTSAFAHAFGEKRNYDCRGGDDGLGGYYCHYNFRECIKHTCSEAAACIVELTARQREGGKEVKAIVESSRSTVLDGEKYQAHEVRRMENCNGNRCMSRLEVLTQIRKPEWTYKVGQCEPVIVRFVDEQ